MEQQCGCLWFVFFTFFWNVIVLLQEDKNLILRTITIFLRWIAPCHNSLGGISIIITHLPRLIFMIKISSNLQFSKKIPFIYIYVLSRRIFTGARMTAEVFHTSHHSWFYIEAKGGSQKIKMEIFKLVLTLGGGGLEGVSFAIKLFWKMIFLKTI